MHCQLPLGNLKCAPATPQQLVPKLVAAFALGGLVFGTTGPAHVLHLHRHAPETTGEPSLLGRQKRPPWGEITGTFELPRVVVADLCADERGQIATCSDGAECKARHYPGRKPPFWCAVAPFWPSCEPTPERVSKDWFCDP